MYGNVDSFELKKNWENVQLTLKCNFRELEKSIVSYSLSSCATQMNIFYMMIRWYTLVYTSKLYEQIINIFTTCARAEI